VKDLQEMMGISRNTAYKMADVDGVACMKLGGKLLFDKEAFDKWRRQHINKVVDIK
jgi:excisionase family DNA binding protein